jgi:hypothetical protein
VPPADPAVAVLPGDPTPVTAAVTNTPQETVDLGAPPADPADPADPAAPPPVAQVDPLTGEAIPADPAAAPDAVPVVDVETPAPPPPPAKRIVRREGIVRRSASIQAPTYFVLESLYDRRIVNYLYNTQTNLVLQDYFGARIAVTGEESVDERWPKTPVITIESLEAVP